MIYRIKQVPSLRIGSVEPIDIFLGTSDMYVAQVKYFWLPFKLFNFYKWVDCYQYRMRATYGRAENDIIEHIGDKK